MSDSNSAMKALVSDNVKHLFVQEHNQLLVENEDLFPDSVKQYKVRLPDELSKIMVITDKIMEFGERVCQVIIFVRTRKSACMLHETLVNYGYAVAILDGAFTRDDTAKDFKDGLTQVLISTDVLASGFDQPQVNLVVNYDLPVMVDDLTKPDYEVYLHRVGRAGRFGRKGAVFNLLCGDRDNMIMEKIERDFNHYVAEVPSWTSDDDFKDVLKKAGLM